MSVNSLSSHRVITSVSTILEATLVSVTRATSSTVSRTVPVPIIIHYSSFVYELGYSVAAKQ